MSQVYVFVFVQYIDSAKDFYCLSFFVSSQELSNNLGIIKVLEVFNLIGHC